MSTVGIGELTEHPTSVIRRVTDLGETVDLTDKGRVVARITPIQESEVDPSSEESTGEVLDRLWRLGEEISKVWPEGVSAVDAIRDVRRDL